jgi:hypothetical protein
VFYDLEDHGRSLTKNVRSVALDNRLKTLVPQSFRSWQ